MVNNIVVKAAYGISWAYVLYDVGKHGMDTHQKGGEPTSVGLAMTKRACFQTLASMALPAFTIRSTVWVAKNITGCLNRGKRWGPTLAGLAVVPILPYLFDRPVEAGVEWVFRKLE